MQNSTIKNNNIALQTCILSLFLICGYIEIVVPFFDISGIKLGLPNLIALISFDIIGYKATAFLSFLRVLIIQTLFGTFFTFGISFGGFLTSILIMIIMKKFFKMSIIIVSLYGSIFHWIGQVVAFGIFSKFFYWNVNIFFTAILFGIVPGLLIGVIANIILKNKYIKNIKEMKGGL
ncbi:MAG: Gx transporter family protein [Eubacteriales bacterium]|nr:Gx transporter family protein [Eubacteriales bacterium]